MSFEGDGHIMVIQILTVTAIIKQGRELHNSRH